MDDRHWNRDKRFTWVKLVGRALFIVGVVLLLKIAGVV